MEVRALTSTMTRENSQKPLVLNRYELEARIGSGGMATVYSARDLKMERRVAIKVVRRTEELNGRAALEARAAAKLNHPNIITVFELAEDLDHIYLVSELVEGRTLAARVADGSLPDRECAAITLQVLEALSHAHERGVIHRDIKPDNIMISDSGQQRVKVMDFGIAQLENTQRLTRQGDIVGTIAYMSPEQAGGEQVDSSTDVYSAALTLYECLTGANPFRAANAAETIGKVQAGASPLAEVRPDLPLELSHAIEEATALFPEERLSLAEFADRLSAVMPALATGDRETVVLRRADLPRPTLYDDLSRRFGSLASRLANAALAALVAWVAVSAFSFYPEPWQTPVVAGVALTKGLLPRLGLLALMGILLAPVFSFSIAAGALLGVLMAVYYLAIGNARPGLSLLPALAVAMGQLGAGLAYPGIAGSLGRLVRGPLLALLGGIAFTAWQLVQADGAIGYLGITDNYGLAETLAEEYRPWAAITAIAEPFEQHPVLLLQPLIWMVAALPAALLIRRRNLAADAAGLLLANAALAGGYFLLPVLIPGFVLPQALLLKTLIICVIIQVTVLLLSPRTRSQVPSP